MKIPNKMYIAVVLNFDGTTKTIYGNCINNFLPFNTIFVATYEGICTPYHEFYVLQEFNELNNEDLLKEVNTYYFQTTINYPKNKDLKFIAVTLNKDLNLKIVTGNIKHGVPKKTIFLTILENISPKFQEKFYNYFLNNFDITFINQIYDFYLSSEAPIKKILEKIEQDKINKINNEENYKKRNDKVKSGDIAYLIDSNFHTCVILNAGKDSSFILMVTSKYKWNGRARKIKEDEFNLLGIPQNKKRSYFAPCVRDTKYLRKSGITYPTDRINELLNEFK